MRCERIAERAAAYKIPGVTIDGNDVLAVYKAAKDAVARARSGEGPTLLELVTYRITGHSRRDPALYQPEDERKAAKENEPIGRFVQYLLAHNAATERVAQEDRRRHRRPDRSRRDGRHRGPAARAGRCVRRYFRVKEWDLCDQWD